MKLPIGPIARFALKRIVLPAVAKAVASDSNPLTKATAKDALGAAIEAEVARQVVRRAGGVRG